jgi:Cu2+-exporting ATPase
LTPEEPVKASAPDGHHDQGHHDHAAMSGAAPRSTDRVRKGADEHSGHDKHAGHSVEMFRQKFLGTLLLSIPTLLWAPMIQHWFGYTAPGGTEASRWISALFGTLVYGYGGLVFVRGARREIADRRPGMMTLVALAISVAFLFSIAVTLASREWISGGSSRLS